MNDVKELTLNALPKATESVNRGSSALGFWIYLMTDTLLFGSLFATYLVLRGSTFGGPGISQLADMPIVLVETFILLLSSFSAGLAIVAMRAGKQKQLLRLLGLTFVLGGIFVGLEINEFRAILADGYSWRSSAFLTAFFTLVGTHGAHISAGLIWLVSAMWRIKKRGLTVHEVRRLSLFSLYWHFLELIWIFIFTVVYLLGVING